jgi:hypothetical protein
MRARNSATIAAVLIAALVVLGVLLVCVVYAPGWVVADKSGLVAAERLKAQNDVRSSLLQGFVGLLALGGAALGAAVTVGQVRANREGRATDLFIKAIDLLASDQMSIRHGGVYALEQLAEVDIDERYRAHAHALLTAFVRQRAPWPPDGTDTEPTATRSMHGGVADDIGAALAVLSRQSVITEGAWSELEWVDLRNAVLDKLTIPRACFAHSNLEGARLVDATLIGATLSDAILRNTDLTRANLDGADLTGADLTGAELNGTILLGANLTNAQLHEANLHGVVADDTTTWPHGFTSPTD